VSDEKGTLEFAAALKRLDKVIAELAFTRGLSIVSATALDTPAFDGAPIRYRITLQNGKDQAIVYLDHEALIDAEECFAVLTLPQLDVAMSRLAHSAKQSIG